MRIGRGLGASYLIKVDGRGEIGARDVRRRRVGQLPAAVRHSGWLEQGSLWTRAASSSCVSVDASAAPAQSSMHPSTAWGRR